MIKITINERIKLLRTQILKNENGKSYSRNDFAMLLSVTRGVIENIEYNRTETKDNIIKLICLTFNVNEEWLRNGVEPIFINDYSHMSINKRLRELRKNILNLTLKNFGSQIGLSPGAIGDIESERTPLQERHIKLICQTFNVNEEWLRDGVEPIFKEDKKENDVLNILKNTYQLNDNDLKFLDNFLSLSKDQRQILYKVFDLSS